jgi:2-C-methyl-D-erythritol 4-phosphate cytidylyltransferase
MEALAIIVAAGRGERMEGGVPKAFLPLGGVPMLVHSVRVFAAAPSVTAIVVVVPAARVDEVRAMLGGIAKPVTVVGGGAQRQDSVRAGLDAAPAEFDGIILVHDAARPFVDVATVEAVAEVALEMGAAIPTLPVTDTIKRMEQGAVRGTIDRGSLAAAQTPQAFTASLLRRAYDAAQRDGAALTDEAMAVERLGGSVAAVPGQTVNRKLTTPDDLVWAEDVLRRRAAQ